MFRRSHSIRWRMGLLLLIAFALMMLDDKWRYFQSIRANLAIVVFPIQYIVSKPVHTWRWLADNITSQHNLVSENMQLRTELLLMRAKLQRLISLEQQNQNLKKLLGSSTALYTNNKVLIAQIVAVNFEAFTQHVMIDKGSRQGVYQGQPVLDADGVFGQVVRVGPWTSQVMLVTDSQSAVPVINARNQLRAIVTGDGYTGTLGLINIVKGSDFRPGDLLISSGLGGVYPLGYPVGKIKQVSNSVEQPFASISLQPLAKLNKSQQVLLVWPETRS